MKKLVAAASFAATFGIYAAAPGAASIDMTDPHRALGREGDVRIDAQLVSDTVAHGAPIIVTWQIQNFTELPVAVDARAIDASYDADSRTITLAIGSEVPDEGNMPLMTLVEPGEKKVFRSAASLAIPAAVVRGRRGGAPRLVQLKVSILRDLDPFAAMIETQSRTAPPQRLSDALFEQWFESTDTIFLNTLPVQWTGRMPSGGNAEHRGRRF
jgi:hypothetical protein